MAWFWFLVAVLLGYFLIKGSTESAEKNGEKEISSAHAPGLEEKLAETAKARDQAVQALALEELKSKDQAKTIKRLADEVNSLKTKVRILSPLERFNTPGQQLASLEQQIHDKEAEAEKISSKIAALHQELTPLELNSIAQEYGLYEPKYDFGSSSRYKAEIGTLRQRQKEMIRAGDAVHCPNAWTVNGSVAAARKMLKEISQLQLRAFNGEVDNLIMVVRFDNIEKIAGRIRQLYQKVNTLDGETGSYITQSYLELKLEELSLVHEYQEKKEEERIEQQAIREQMREEARAQKELEKAQAQAAAEEQRYARALETARREMERAEGTRREEMQAELDRLTAELAEAQAKNQRAISMAQQTRAGHVYVISNIGSFGEDVFKIGMTRRLEPLDRVKELSSASVPFEFDVHAVIYSPDAPKLEAELHRAFEKYRVNKINPRKEFFKVPLSEIERVVKENHGEIEFTLTAEAHDYRQTRAMQAAS